MSQEYATVVIGGGLAGLEVARQLVEHDAGPVLVLESGPAGDPRHTNVTHPPAAAAALWLEPQDDPYFRRPWSSANPPHFAGSAGLRSRLGGRSLYWYGVSLPMDPWALRSWPAGIVADLTGSWCGGPSLYDLVSADLGVTGAPDRPAVSFGSLRLRQVPRAATAAGAPGRWAAWSPLDHWRDPVTGEVTGWPPGLTVRTGCTVRRITTTGGRADGVEFLDHDTGVVQRIAADQVVIAAGTVESSRLAIQALAGAGAEPRLGGLADHIAQGFFVRLDATRLPRPLPLRPGTYYLPVEAARSILFVSLWRVSRTEMAFDVKINGEQAPDPGSRVVCDPAGTQPWPCAVHAALSPADRRLIEDQRAVLGDVWSTVAAAFGLTGDLGFGSFERPESPNTVVLEHHRDSVPIGVPLTWSSPLGAEDHEGGTLPLGRVLTTDHEFRDVPGLYAAGPATFPRIGAANPSLTTIALARRLARIVAGRAPAHAPAVAAAGRFDQT